MREAAWVVRRLVVVGVLVLSGGVRVAAAEGLAVATGERKYPGPR